MHVQKCPSAKCPNVTFFIHKLLLVRYNARLTSCHRNPACNPAPGILHDIGLLQLIWRGEAWRRHISHSFRASSHLHMPHIGTDPPAPGSSLFNHMMCSKSHQLQSIWLLLPDHPSSSFLSTFRARMSFALSQKMSLCPPSSSQTIAAPPPIY